MKRPRRVVLGNYTVQTWRDDQNGVCCTIERLGQRAVISTYDAKLFPRKRRVRLIAEVIE